MPLLDAFNTHHKAINTVVSLLTVLVLICGGLISLFEYLEHKQNQKINISLAIIKRHQTGEIFQHRLSINKMMQEAHSDIKDLFERDKTNKGYIDFMIDLINKQKMGYKIRALFNLYEEAIICVELSLCDQKTIDRYLTIPATAFFRTYFPYICGQRDKWSNSALWQEVEIYINEEQNEKLCL
ncbi:hypothetical protein DXX93_10265 [Thalassotalea euphylliae]|uniref:DUF4760 domain-containing protein n=1 Tax=Thalassotalea euphylliae TaxID=1655234 RepID=A0A3E0TSL2_9GAMM|nr:hypothetical protein [Thalassotalea euphylliae]REL26915.1 hypothetical protein DXX93_10265 [Thalassotalea euphylliae]